MNKLTISPAHRIREAGDNAPKNIIMVAVSAAAHLIFFLVLVFAPNQLLPARPYKPSVIKVSMVSLPGQDLNPGTGKTVPVTPAPKPKKSEVEVKPPKAAENVPPAKKAPEQKLNKPDEVSISTASAADVHPSANTISISPKKKKAKASLKKKTFRSSQVIKKAIKRIKKKSQRERPRTVTDAIDRMRKEVQQAKPVTSATATARKDSGTGFGGTESGAGTLGRPGVSGGQLLRQLEQIDLYKLQIAYRIEKKWAFSEQLSGGRKDLEAILVIKIMSNGEIHDIWFEKKSGNNYFDDSAYKAIQKSNPLPPLPRGYLHPFYNVGLVFTPAGLNRGSG